LEWLHLHALFTQADTHAHDFLTREEFVFVCSCVSGGAVTEGEALWIYNCTLRMAGGGLDEQGQGATSHGGDGGNSGGGGVMQFRDFVLAMEWLKANGKINVA